MKKILVVGAGLSGAVIARTLADAGYSILVLESRDHVGGNCFTQRDNETGIMVHVYGPHIFHTDDNIAWEYVQKFDEFLPYINRVKTTVNGRVYSLPINLHTINQFFEKCFSPAEAKNFIKNISSEMAEEPGNFEEQALKFIGKDLYEAFFKGYTIKQWGVYPQHLPASILKRLPVRFDYNDNYFSHRFQGMPIHGYGELISNILNHPLIETRLNDQYHRNINDHFFHIFYTGPLDKYFDFDMGRLPYRTLDFEALRYDGDFQGCAVMNYGNKDVPYTRITEHKYFSPWEDHSRTIIYREYSRDLDPGDIPYYPINSSVDDPVVNKYRLRVSSEKNVSFYGRLGTYRYLDMDVSIREALDGSNKFINLNK